MDRPLTPLDWSLVQAFLAVAEAGSLTAAARRLGASQPTLGRQIRTLESRLGTDLFHRQPRGLTLTETGAALIAPANAMAEAMRAIALTAAGRDSGLEGTVRLTASVAMSWFTLPAIVARIRAEEPAISVDLVATDDSTNLLWREADIAVRMYRPTQLDLVAQHLGEVELAAFAARSYVDRRGLPATLAEVRDHDFVGYDRHPAIIDGFRAAGVEVDRAYFKARCDDTLGNWALVRAGCGIGVGQARVGRADPDLVELDLGLPMPTLPVWLTAHEAMRQTPRIRRVWDMLAEGLRPHCR